MTEYGIPEDHIFSSRDLTFVEGVMRMTGGKGVDLVLNSLSGEVSCISSHYILFRDFVISLQLARPLEAHGNYLLPSVGLLRLEKKMRRPMAESRWHHISAT